VYPVDERRAGERGTCVRAQGFEVGGAGAVFPPQRPLHSAWGWLPNFAWAGEAGGPSGHLRGMASAHTAWLQLDTEVGGGSASQGPVVTENEMVLLVCLGHSLAGTESPLALLSKDILADFVAPAIRRAHMESRAAAGLLTPPAIKWRAAPRSIQMIPGDGIPAGALDSHPLVISEAKRRTRRVMRFGGGSHNSAPAAAAGGAGVAQESASVFFPLGSATAPVTLVERIKGVDAPLLPISPAKTVRKSSRISLRLAQVGPGGGGSSLERGYQCA